MTDTKDDQTHQQSKPSDQNASKLPNHIEEKTTDIKTSKRAGKYVIVGICVTIFNYILYAVFANFIIKNNDLIWLSSFISTAITTIVAYLAHSRITWKERHVTKYSILRFFIWNAMLAIAISPLLTQLFGYLTPLYDFAYHICTAIHLPFSYDFVLTTGAFALTSLVIMVLNFLFYDKFVFGKTSGNTSSKSSTNSSNTTKHL